MGLAVALGWRLLVVTLRSLDGFDESLGVGRVLVFGLLGSLRSRIAAFEFRTVVVVVDGVVADIEVFEAVVGGMVDIRWEDSHGSRPDNWVD